MIVRDPEPKKLYICNIHKQYARYKERQDFLSHLEFEHGIDVKDQRMLKAYLKQGGVWVDKSLNKADSK